MSSTLKEVQSSLKSLIISSPKDLTINDLSRDYKNMEGRDIPYKELGFNNLEVFLRSIPETLTVYGHGKDAKLKAQNAGKISHIQGMISKQKNCSLNLSLLNQPGSERGRYRTNENYERRYNQNNYMGSNSNRPKSYTQQSQGFIQKSHQGTNKQPSSRPALTQNKNQNYNSYQHSSSNYRPPHNSMNMPSTMNTFNDRNDSKINRTFNQVGYRRIDDDKFNKNKNHLDTKMISTNKLSELDMVKNKKSALENTQTNKNLNKLINDEEPIPLDLLNDSIFMSIDIPEEALPIGVKIKPAPITEHFSKSNLLSLYITEIHNPVKFWFHIMDPDNNLDKLMDKLQKTYNHSPNKYTISCPTPNNYCVTQFNGLWHRAKILQEPLDNKVKVYFLDYGTTLYVPLNSLKYLLRQFGELPAQAYRGALSHIKSASSFWTQPSANHMLNLVHEQLLYGKISEINYKHSVTYMIVCDSNGENDIQFNKNLMENGFAVFDPDWLSSLTEIEIKTIYEFEFPNFEQLESGKYPSFEEISLLMKQGMTNLQLIKIHKEHELKLRESPEKIQKFLNQDFIKVLINLIESNA